MYCFNVNNKYLLGNILVVLMVVFPLKFQAIKLVLVIAIVFYLFTKSTSIKVTKSSIKILIWGYLYMILGLFAICNGLILGNPSPDQYFLVYVAWPIIFTLLSLLIDREYLYYLFDLIKYCLLVIIVLGLIAGIGYNIGVIQSAEFLGFEPVNRPGYPIVCITGASVTTVLFWYFYYFVKSLLQDKFFFSEWLIMILGIVFFVLTSRRILFVNFVLAFVISLMLFCFIKKDNEKTRMLKSFRIKMFYAFVLFALIAFGANKYNLFDFNALGDFIEQTSEISDSARMLQFNSLIDGWFNKPLFGNGAGVNASVVRSDVPGTYELYYIAMLFERGVFGFFVFAILYIVLMYWSISCLNKKVISIIDTFPLIVAVNLFMIANATNPYLNAFDYIWFLFILLTVVRLSNEKSK